ncbi:ATP-grasp domain-containing protein [Candidatus Uabimicrobium sp. HlEnr_7]|uniref:ATP-grasp domain-containing protein n=1 Tax=Candidatus Uabimicrobium helgolandensis TaxID=3095367 RepID=UPI00355749FF
MSKDIVIVVDAFSSGNQLAPIINKHNLPVVHVFSIANPSSALMATYYKEHFIREYTGNVEELIEKISNDGFVIKAVLPGTETAISLTDKMTDKLGLSGNKSISSLQRFNKYEMIEALRRAGVPTTKQIKSLQVNDILEWQQRENEKKIIVKPLESAGSDCVFACEDQQDVIHAFHEIIGQENQMGGTNIQVLAQEFLDGDEFYVNAVSCDKEHFICEVWRYHKKSLHGRDFVYDYNEYIPLDTNDERVTALCDYMLQVLDTLDFRYGPSHAEIKITSSGPRLVEIGARLQGMAAFGINAKIMGFTPAELTVDSYLSPQDFHQRIANVKRQPLHARRVFLRSYQSGKLEAINYHGEIEKLASCMYLRWIKQPGDKLKPTIDYFSIPAIVVLAHNDLRQIEKDYEFIRSFERGNLFVMENDID